ncbi:hypothetical protein TNCV_4239541 [Trichonephila clavipes]|nr:hypothetical protein TNCV_4239541 [Trichonephila clavipes]
MWNPQKAGYLLRNILGSKVSRSGLGYHPNYPNFSAANRRLSRLLQPTNDVASTPKTIIFRQNPQDLSR